jgi:PAS domain S-box-containing protein
MHLPGVIYQFRLRPDGSSHFPYASPGIQAIYGVLPDDVKDDATPAFKALHPDDLERVSKSIMLSARNLDLWHDIYRVNLPGDKMIWVEGKSTPQKMDDGSILWHGFIQDITERKKAEIALEQYNDIVENIQLGLYIYHLEDVDDDSTLRLTYANPATEKATGVKVKDVLGKTLDENFPHLRAMNVPQRYAEVVINQEQKTFEDIFYSDDRVVQAVFSVKAFPLPNNYVGIAFENITERVQAQIQVAASNSRLKLAQEIGNVGSWELDFISNIVTWSEQTYRIYEEDTDTFEVNFDNIVAHYPPADKAAVITALNKTLAEQIDFNIEHVIITGKGNTRFVMESGRLIFSDENKPVKLVGSVADITERKQVEEALSLAKDKAEESDRLKTAFLNNISHEIRTPLNGITGFGDLMMDGGLSPQEKIEYHSILKASSDRLQQTVDDIIDISELNAGTIKPLMANVPVGLKMADYAQQLEMACAGKNIISGCQIPSDLIDLVLTTDEDLFDKIMKHLLSNAVKFTLSGRISLGFSKKVNEVEFFIKDTGKGIAADKLELVFKPFMQEDVSNTRGHEGSGLGLSIARGMTELLGGKLWVESEKGVGSSFFFTLPLIETARETKPELEVADKPKSSAQPVILIAEDDENNAQLMQVLMRKAGYTTLYAGNGQEAVDLCHEYPEISLIVMDIKMPVLNGLEATQQIKQFRPGLPIIALTAQAQQSDKVTILEAGCDHYFAKPFNTEELIKKIKLMTA